MSGVGWLEPLTQLLSHNTPVTLVTITQIRGHSPRDLATKMLVTQTNTFGTIGGGKLEAKAIERARTMLELPAAKPEHLHVNLTEKANDSLSLQCCGGEVTLLLEVISPFKPTVTVFGLGHVGLALAKILSGLEISLNLVDTRSEMLSPERLSVLATKAKLHTHQLPIPESIIGDLPPHSHIVIMTHDHFHDLAILDMALRYKQLSFIGLIGSSTKWQNFRHKLLQEGFHEHDLQRVTCPIGRPDIPSKIPEMIAISVAAQLASQLNL